MHYKIFIYFLFILLFSCEHHKPKIIHKTEIKDVEKKIVKEAEKSSVDSDIEKIDASKKLKVYNNKGFTLIYSENLFKKKIVSKKIDEKSKIVFNKYLLKNTPVKITNLLNGKNIISKTSDIVNYPYFYNSLISKRIVDELSIDESEPYIQLESLNSKNIYVANETKTFDEEKNVANKAPVDTIIIQNIGIVKSEKTQKIIKINKNFKYIIKFADLYFEESAIMLKERLENEFNIENISIKKLSKNSFRVYKGPFKNLDSLKNAYNGIEKLDFENIEIIKS